MTKETQDVLKHLAELKAQEDAVRTAGPIAAKEAVTAFNNIGGVIVSFVSEFNQDKFAKELGLNLRLDGPTRGWNDSETAYLIRLLRGERIASSLILEISHSSLPIDDVRYASLKLTAWQNHLSLEAFKQRGLHGYAPGQEPKCRSSAQYELKQRGTTYEWTEKGKPGKEGLTTAVSLIEEAVCSQLLRNLIHAQD